MKTKVSPLVNLNVNPCKMCMPMGAVTAFYGIKNCITILHGSQGCSTYIRRHMATHYNEPVDIASSSLTEHGTIYGGEDNLKKGLNNLIDLYNPQVVGVMTTCLAETIGEDVHGIIDHFYEENPHHKDIVIVPVSSPGYGGTQYEGYFAALCAMVSQLEMDTAPNGKVNVITAPLSPADTRYLKQVFSLFGLDVILLPDLSDNLDGGHKKDYSRLPAGGTDIADIRKMGGARFTLELCGADTESPAKILFCKYNIPFKRLNMPVGLRDTDAFYKALSVLTGKGIPPELLKIRSRYLDGMIDSHKYNAAGRAVIFGEPDFVISTVRLCCENGVMPVAAVTGCVYPELKQLVEAEIKKLADSYFVEDFIIQDDVDFKEIEEFAQKTNANLLVGNSDGRRIEEKLHIPLVRRGFPIHDRVGGQRLRMLGYEGSLAFLDEITNALLHTTESTFRDALYEKYYTEEKQEATPAPKETPEEIMRKKTEEHPCYNCQAHKFARIHLPVAPACNVQCNYCVRKFDCPNESRPGITSAILTPEEALERYKAAKEKVPNLTVVGIAGPGDALANFPETKRTLELIRAYDSEVTFCLSTNGLMLPAYAHELAALGVSHVTVTMNAVDPKISAKVYKYIDYMGTRYEGECAGALMITNQLSGLRMLIASGVVCKVNIVTLRGINETHIPEVVQTVKDLGCFITNIMQLIPVKGSAFEQLPMVSNKEINEIRNECGKIMKQMFHCRQCRADAVGTLDDDQSVNVKSWTQKQAPETKKSRFAVATKSGMVVDAHFGHVTEFYLYDFIDGKAVFAGKQSIQKYCEGADACDEKEDKIEIIARALTGCDGIIAMRIGDTPKEKLIKKGFQIFTTYDIIEEAVKQAALSM